MSSGMSSGSNSFPPGRRMRKGPSPTTTAVGEREPRQGAVLQGFVEPGDVRIAASLRAMLHHHSILRRRGDGDPDAVVGTPHRRPSAWRREQQRSSGCRRREKPAAGSGAVHPSISLWEAAGPRIITNGKGRMRLCVGMGFRSMKPPLCRPPPYPSMGYDRESLGEEYRPHETPTAHRSE